jgi:hypothetical protein
MLALPPVAKLPAAVQKSADEMSRPNDIPSALEPGLVQTSTARRLMSDVGSDHQSFYAAPTSKGQLCFASSNGSSGCVDSFAHQAARVSWFLSVVGSNGNTGAVQVGGLVPDDIEKIDVATGTITYSARLEHNFFFAETDPDVWPKTLIVTYRDGSIARVDLPSPPTPASAP